MRPDPLLHSMGKWDGKRGRKFGGPRKTADRVKSAGMLRFASDKLAKRSVLAPPLPTPNPRSP